MKLNDVNDMLNLGMLCLLHSRKENLRMPITAYMSNAANATSLDKRSGRADRKAQDSTSYVA